MSPIVTQDQNLNRSMEKMVPAPRQAIKIYVYAIDWCRGRELNSRHMDFQSIALPLSYPGLTGGHAKAPQDSSYSLALPQLILFDF